MSRRRRQQRLERVLGTPALFSTAYGNVGSSIYYALGVTAVFALGLTPLVFVIAGIFFSATALTYAEGTVRYPEAGGSASFARHAFNELASFGAGWAQMLNYIITIAITACIVHFGSAPTWSQFFLSIPFGMIAYTGIETVSNLAEEARDPVKSIPRSIGAVAVAVYAIYFTLPLIALSALPVHVIDGKETTLLALPPDNGGFQNDAVLGLVENLGIGGTA